MSSREQCENAITVCVHETGTRPVHFFPDSTLFQIYLLSGLSYSRTGLNVVPDSRFTVALGPEPLGYGRGLLIQHENISYYHITPGGSFMVVNSVAVLYCTQMARPAQPTL
jgi:hypothetical protein